MVTWDPQLGWGEVISALAFLAAGGGLWFAGCQLRDATKVRRAQFLLSATERYFLDAEVRKLYYDIDYGKFAIQFNKRGEPTTYTRCEAEAKPFIGSDEERYLDGLLYTFDTIGRIVDIGALSMTEAKLFSFQARRVFGDSSVVRLLAWLNRERERFGGEVPAHQAGRWLAELKHDNKK